MQPGRYGGYDAYPVDRGYPMERGYPVDRGYPEPLPQPRVPRYYDPQPPQPVYPREVQRYHSSNPPAPSTREVKVIYYDPNNANFLPPAPPRALPTPSAFPAPKSSYIEMPSGGAKQFQPGDVYKVVAVNENRYSVPPRGTYEYHGGFNDYVPTMGQRGVGEVRRVPQNQYYPY